MIIWIVTYWRYNFAVVKQFNTTLKMNNNFTKHIFVTLLLALFSVSFSFASDNETKEKPIVLKPVVGTTAPTTPQSPSSINLSAITDRDGVIVSSTDSVVAHIKVTDSLNGDCYYDQVVTLSPSYRCALTGIREELTIHISIDDTEYIGYFELNW